MHNLEKCNIFDARISRLLPARLASLPEFLVSLLGAWTWEASATGTPGKDRPNLRLRAVPAGPRSFQRDPEPSETVWGQRPWRDGPSLR